MEPQCIIIAGYQLAFKKPLTKADIYHSIKKFNDKKCDINILYLPGKNNDNHRIYISLNFCLLPGNGILNTNDLLKVLSTMPTPIPNHFSNIINELSLQPSFYSIYCDHVIDNMEILL